MGFPTGTIDKEEPIKEDEKWMFCKTCPKRYDNKSHFPFVLKCGHNVC